VAATRGWPGGYPTSWWRVGCVVAFVVSIPGGLLRTNTAKWDTTVLRPQQRFLPVPLGPNQTPSHPKSQPKISASSVTLVHELSWPVATELTHIAYGCIDLWPSVYWLGDTVCGISQRRIGTLIGLGEVTHLGGQTEQPRSRSGGSGTEIVSERWPSAPAVPELLAPCGPTDPWSAALRHVQRQNLTSAFRGKTALPSPCTGGHSHQSISGPQLRPRALTWASTEMHPCAGQPPPLMTGPAMPCGPARAGRTWFELPSSHVPPAPTVPIRPFPRAHHESRVMNCEKRVSNC